MFPSSKLRTWAHPRVCGENCDFCAHFIDVRGSSPRVRGKQAEGRRFRHLRGLIPACAGKTMPIISTCAASRAHPRVCGENRERAANLLKAEGSSPRVRGKHDVAALRRVRRWLIPACAGKTQDYDSRKDNPGAHPRVCGENPYSARPRLSGEGSSPRVRGKPASAQSTDDRTGLIPACAGKTSPCRVGQ